MKHLIISLVSLSLIAAALISCSNTVQGLGKDMQDNGQVIQESAKNK